MKNISDILKPGAKLKPFKLTKKQTAKLVDYINKSDEFYEKQRIRNIEWWHKIKDVPMTI